MIHVGGKLLKGLKLRSKHEPKTWGKAKGEKYMLGENDLKISIFFVKLQDRTGSMMISHGDSESQTRQSPIR